MAYWLIKGEPGSYGWADLVAEGGTEWDGIRNATAARNLRAMRVGDTVLFYHSGAQKAVVGIARVAREARPDGPEEDGDGRWVSVRVEPLEALARPVTLAAMKAAPALAGSAVLRQGRLSVAPITPAEWTVIRKMAAI